MDGAVCHNLYISLEKNDKDIAYGGDYLYIGTVQLRDGSGKFYPFYKQKDPDKPAPPLYMYHSGQMFVATV